VLGVFAEITGSPQDLRNVVGLYAGGGIALFGPLPSRPKDVLGLAGSVLRFTNDFQAHEEAAGTPVGAGEAVLELTYQIAIAPWLVVQPDAQFFFNPPFSRRDAQAIGAQVVAIF
jgi:porin